MYGLFQEWVSDTSATTFRNPIKEFLLNFVVKESRRQIAETQIQWNHIGHAPVSNIPLYYKNRCRNS